MIATILGKEPVLLYSVIRQAILVAVLFGLKLDAAQVAGICLLVENVLLFVTRAVVASPATVKELKAQLEAARSGS